MGRRPAFTLIELLVAIGIMALLMSILGPNNHEMQRPCVNRRGGAQHCLFADGSVRKVALKQLWPLRWHRQYDTAGPWTAAGGVLPTDWPKWMAGLKDAF